MKYNWTLQDLKSLSEFWRIVKNYIKIKVIQKRNETKY